MTQTSTVIFHNLFSRISAEAFNTAADEREMSPWKWRQLDKYMEIAMQNPTPYSRTETYHLLNPLQEKRRQRIYDEERHSIDTSIETLSLLNLIIYNINSINVSGINVDGVIHLGRYLREEGHKVDYVKLDSWIKQLFIRRMSSLVSSVLLYVFNFEIDELPFLYHKYPEAKEMLCKQIAQAARSGVQQHNRMANLRYSPLGSAAMAWQKLRTTLSNIEE